MWKGIRDLASGVILGDCQKVMPRQGRAQGLVEGQMVAEKPRSVHTAAA